MDTKYLKIIREFQDIEKRLSDGANFDPEIHREYKKLKPFYEKVSQLQRIEQELDNLESLKDDEQLRQLYEEEVKRLKGEQAAAEAQLNGLFSRSPFEGRPIIGEIRAGTGGREASIFAADLFKMYQRLAESNGLKFEVFSLSATDMGGIKEVVFEVNGGKAYYFFRYEGGVHRVQRVPVTESGGRIHTSAASVAVYPEPEEVEVEIDPADLRIDTYRASGKGGQHVNKTDSAVRITHIPTGVVASCQDERSQGQNKRKAMKMLKARIYEKQEESAQESTKNLRREQVGHADRSEKIRTYNFPQNRVTDHRIKMTIHNLSEFMDGKIDDMTSRLWDELARQEPGSAKG